MEVAAFTHAFVHYEDPSSVVDSRSIESLIQSLPNPSGSALGSVLALGIVTTAITTTPQASYATLLPETVGLGTADIQLALSDRGYYDGALDGVYGAETEAAVVAFQQDEGLFIDGVVGEDTLTRLELIEPEPLVEDTVSTEPAPDADLVDDREPVVDAGDSTIANVQLALADLGYYPGAIDGILGEETEAAILTFQRDRGLVVDGVLGTETLSALGLIAAPPVVQPPVSLRPEPSDPTPIAPVKPAPTPAPDSPVVTQPSPVPDPTPDGSEQPGAGIVNEEEFEIGRIATIAADRATIYSQPNTSSDNQLSLEKGTFIAYTKRIQLETGEQWYFLPAYEGWISGNVVTLIDS
ncbi:MAG: hypothetical protein HC881_15365 [Leptolyngbyaceae cyanobacterium SL_7_1]|nr:hypothetical protein [Leptolyngbyaceae cyanobacterium SL_7_1]